MSAYLFDRNKGIALGILAVAFVASACDVSPRDNLSTDLNNTDNRLASNANAWTPFETVRRVHDFRMAGQLSSLENHLLPEQRLQVLELIQAVDALMLANKALGEKIAERFGPATAQSFDQSSLVDQIGVFSKSVAILAEKIDNNRAVVTIQVGNRLPLQEVNLFRRDDRWLIETDPPIPELATEIRRLSDVWIELAKSLDRKSPSLAELQSELAARQSAVVRRLHAGARTKEN